MRTNTKKIVLNSLLLAMGLLLRQLTPVFGLPIQPDIALAMLFTIMIMNKDDYKICLVSGMVAGIFAALTTKFPGGQIPNIIDKTLTVNIMYVVIIIMYKLPLLNKIHEERQNLIVSAIILPIGTVVSGSLFLLIAQILVGLPGATFKELFMVAVVPAVGINTLVGIFLFKIVSMSIKRISYKIN